jgi:methionine synthase II (cobalamin-independent)
VTDAGPLGRATGIGSWPGTDPAEAQRTIFGELTDPHLPYLPELPDRGPGGDMIGRAATLLVDLPVDLQPAGWRLVDRPGRDLARARSWLREDLEVLAETADGFTGQFKLQVAGPWTLSAGLVLPRLERAVVDPGASRDLVASLAEGIGQQVAEVRRLVPGAFVVVQIDEPSLPAVLRGRLPTASGFGRLRAVEEQVAVEGLRTVLTAARSAGAAATVVHCCAREAPIESMVRAGAGTLSLDLTRIGQPAWESVAVAVEAGVGLWAGVVPAAAVLPSATSVAETVATPWHRLGLPRSGLGGVVVTPTCGLAALSLPNARAAMNRAREAASALAELAVG